MVDLVRETVKFQHESTMGKCFRFCILGPKSTSDADILVSYSFIFPFLPNPRWLSLFVAKQQEQEFINKTAAPLWHTNGTVKMGTVDDVTACVDSKFCIYGLQNLRVADSVAPLMVK